MLKDSRERRVKDAQSLTDAVNALSTVKDEHRKDFIHDRLMQAVEDLCIDQKTGKKIFQQVQIDALKSISYHIVYLTDSHRRPKPGFVKRLLSEFLETKPIAQISIILGILGALFFGVVAFLNGVAAYRSHGWDGVQQFVTTKGDFKPTPATAVPQPPSQQK